MPEIKGKLCGKTMATASRDNYTCCLPKRHPYEHITYVFCKVNCNNYIGNHHCIYCGQNDGRCYEHMHLHELECTKREKLIKKIRSAGVKVRKTTAKKRKPKKKIEPLGYVVPDHFDFDRVG